MLVETWGLPLAVTVISVGVRCTVDQKNASFRGVVQALAVGLLVGSLINFYLIDYATDNGQFLTHNQRTAIVGVSAAISNEIYTGIIKLAGKFMTDPVGLLKRIFNK